MTSNEINKYPDTLQLFHRLKAIATDRPGYGYYKYPLAGGSDEHLPDIILIDKEYGVCAIDVYAFTLECISEIKEDEWIINSSIYDSPFLKLEDYRINMQAKYEKYRPLRRKIEVNTVIVFPLITKSEFEKKFNNINCNYIIFSDFLTKSYNDFWVEKSSINKEESDLFISVSQGAGRLNNFKQIHKGEKADKIGKAIKLIDSKIASLDRKQHAAAIQIPDGPQRIRGMAGTGKTIILTMKAAFLHASYPDAKILYTFHTQSLYNQIKNLITKFYRETEEKDPDWDKLIVIHSWGSKYKEGVYTRTCMRNSIRPVPFANAKYQSEPLDFVCSDALQYDLSEEFDFILMDEAQDFPPSFFQLIHKITYNPKRIIFAYDELQSLNHMEIPDTDELFGYETDGRKRVDFSRGVYENDIEMDYVLEKSYRNPLEVLMVAHGLGLGLYNTDGYMQAIEDIKIWNGIGYNVLQGNCIKDDEMIIERPKENSISVVHEVYNGNVKPLLYKGFDSREEEIEWICNNIINDINNEEVLPQDIIVITLDNNKIKDNFSRIQHLLFKNGIPSIIPGIDSDRDQFGEQGYVTLSTVYKAKGNEAFIVYVMNFDYLFDYVEFVNARNKAFTSISRSKGWCRITGVGTNMIRAIDEIEKIINNIPQFRFVFPDKEKIARKLSTEEHARRLQEQKKGSKAIDDLMSIDKDFFKSLPEEEKRKILERLGIQ